MKNGWKPIETPPENNCEVDLWVIHHIFTDQGFRRPRCWFSNGEWLVHDPAKEVYNPLDERLKPVAWREIKGPYDD